MKKIAILGSTGSIGTQTLEVIEENRDCFQVTALSCDQNTALLERQIEIFQPEMAVVSVEADARRLAAQYPHVAFLSGMEGLCAAARSDCDLVVNALVGMRGLLPTMEAVLADKDIALANKETLVAGGALVMEALQKQKGRLIPVDSEHSAIFQCLSAEERKDGRAAPDMGAVKRLILTASGGPFRGYAAEQLQSVTVQQALRHPNWAMGKKITIDSATMMNKGLEIIEAHWLFGLPEAAIDVLIHPQSIIHSMVEYRDGSIIAQLGTPDMKGPIRVALAYPQRMETDDAPLDFFGAAGCLTFEEPDAETFTCLKLARQVMREAGSSYPIVLNAANEVLVALFLEEKIAFLDIQNTIEAVLEAHRPEYRPAIGRIMEIDEETRKEVGRRWRL